MNQPRPAADDGTPSDDNAKLPHDNDESAKGGTAAAQQGQNRAVGRQALADVESEQQDTDRHGTPSNVPSSKDNAKK